jgi:hypothetical protein
MWQVLPFPRRPLQQGFAKSRRGSRVPLKVVIAIEDGAQGRTCEGETIVVNLHGMLAATAIGLATAMGISIHLYLTDNVLAPE